VKYEIAHSNSSVPMKTLERVEQLIDRGNVESDAIIADEIGGLAILLFLPKAIGVRLTRLAAQCQSLRVGQSPLRLRNPNWIA
jgi:hypothetical protein